jgi:hypothetical protein
MLEQDLMVNDWVEDLRNYLMKDLEQEYLKQRVIDFLFREIE